MKDYIAILKVMLNAMNFNPLLCIKSDKQLFMCELKTSLPILLVYTKSM